MFLPLPLVVSATVNLVLTPLRRIRLLMAVEDDLADEGVVPSNRPQFDEDGKKIAAAKRRGGFGGPVGCAKFLYQMGGVRAFYRGAPLEYCGVVLKYLIQVSVVVPICRRVPLQMQRSYMLTTLFHTVILFLPIAPVQLVIDTIVVNACSDFVRRDAAAEAAEKAGSAPISLPAPPPPVTEVDGGNYRFRFASLWEAAKAAKATLPILPLANKLMLLDFAGRYISSLVFNKVIGYFYDKILGDGTNVRTDNQKSMMLLLRVVPPLVSIGYGLLTYPTVSLPFTHFVRVRLHERESAAEALVKDDEEREYRRPLNATINGSSSNKSFGGSRSMRLAAYPRDEEDALWMDKAVEILCHWDVRDHLYFTYEQWGLKGLYRGYTMQVATIVAGVVCGSAVNSLVMHAQHTLESALHLDHHHHHHHGNN